MSEPAPRYRNPKPTVDLIIELADAPGQIVFIVRKHEPRGLALPGGFVDSDPSRDRRQHTISIVFLAHASGQPVGGDDAATCLVCAPDALPQPLVFDHATMIADYLAYKRDGVRPPPRR
ncbi:MAG TPA: hypothetical protein VH165_07210 [Kofleriaceae bacterium]|jgi:8-oxo-dGTP diphosphatase|nr:hypothetical protein [Kofleriaceae bacterium]